ncbi:MAG: NAD(P)/FAD-dependent oxidoreductase [Flavobacteriales bacterium]
MLSFKQLSYWEQALYLHDNTFVIVGAGIVGMSTALSLKQRFPHEKILMLERGYLPTGASTKNAGFACFGSPTELHDDLQQMPATAVWQTVELRLKGLQMLKERIKPAQMAWRPCGSWDLIGKQHEQLDQDFITELNQNFEQYFGLKKVFTIDHQAPEKFGFSGFPLSYFNQYEGSIETHLLIDALFKQCIAADIHFLFDTSLEAFESSDQEVLVSTSKGELRTQHLFICTNGFSQAYFPNELRPARAQVCITKPMKHRIQGTFHSESGYYYFRDIGPRILLGGGRNLDFIGETSTEFELNQRIQEKLQEKLENEIFPGQKVAIESQWSGIMCVGDQKKPIIRSLNKNVHAGVRMGGMGIAIGSAVGLELSNLV